MVELPVAAFDACILACLPRCNPFRMRMYRSGGYHTPYGSSWSCPRYAGGGDRPMEFEPLASGAEVWDSAKDNVAGFGISKYEFRTIDGPCPWDRLAKVMAVCSLCARYASPMVLLGSSVSCLGNAGIATGLGIAPYYLQPGLCAMMVPLMMNMLPAGTEVCIGGGMGTTGTYMRVRLRGDDEGRSLFPYMQNLYAIECSSKHAQAALREAMRLSSANCRMAGIPKEFWTWD